VTPTSAVTEAKNFKLLHNMAFGRRMSKQLRRDKLVCF